MKSALIAFAVIVSLCGCESLKTFISPSPSRTPNEVAFELCAAVYGYALAVNSYVRSPLCVDDERIGCHTVALGTKLLAMSRKGETYCAGARALAGTDPNGSSMQVTIKSLRALTRALYTDLKPTGALH